MNQLASFIDKPANSHMYLIRTSFEDSILVGCVLQRVLLSLKLNDNGLFHSIVVPGPVKYL